MGTKIIKRAFNAGECSPLFKYRNDVEKHGFACQKLENFYVSPLGAISRRGGTRLIDVLGASSPFFDCRLVPFEYNSSLSYIFCFYADGANNQTTYTGRSLIELPNDFKIKIFINRQNSETIFKLGNLTCECFFEDTTGAYTLKVGGDGAYSMAVIGGSGVFEIEIAYQKGKLWFSGFEHVSDDVKTSFLSGAVEFSFKQSGEFIEYDFAAESAYGTVFLDAGGAEIKPSRTVYNSSNNCMLKVFNPDGNVLFEAEETPLPLKALQEFQFKQVGGYFFFAHPLVSPKKCAIDLVEKTLEWTNAVSLEPSLDTQESAGGIDMAAECSSIEESSENELLIAGKKIKVVPKNGLGEFNESFIGSQIRLEYTDEATRTYKWKYDSKNGVKDYVTDWFAPAGKITVNVTGGNWDGVLILEESTDNGNTWSEIGRTVSIESSANEGIPRETFTPNSICRVRMLEQNKVTSTTLNKIEEHKEGCFFTIETSGRSSAWAKITALNETWFEAELLSPARNSFTATKIFKSAWSGVYGYPRTVDIHEERLCFAGTTRNPHTIWLSQTNNWDNFRSVSNLETDPLSFTLAANEGEPICWITSVDDLMIGTSSEEWSLGSRDSSQSLSASIVQAKRQSVDGSEYIMPAQAGGMLIYVKRGYLGLEAIRYDFASDSYGSNSLTTMHPDILKTGVKCVFNQLTPQNRIYCVRKDGEVAVFTYVEKENVAAWGRLTFGDGALSACALSDNGLKSVFLAVMRGDFICLERLDPEERGTNNWLDCVPIRENLEIPSGLKHTVAYESLVETEPLFLDENTAVNSAKLYFENSGGGKVKAIGFDRRGDFVKSDWQEILPNSNYIDASTIAQTYRAEVKLNSGYVEEFSIAVKTNEEAPFTLCALGLKILS